MEQKEKKKVRYLFVPILGLILILCVAIQLFVFFMLDTRSLIPKIDLYLLANRVHIAEDNKKFQFDDLPEIYIPTNGIVRVFQKDPFARDNVLAFAFYLPNGELQAPLARMKEYEKQGKRFSSEVIKTIKRGYWYYFKDSYKDTTVNRIPKLKIDEIDCYCEGSQDLHNGVIQFSVITTTSGKYFYGCKYLSE